MDLGTSIIAIVLVALCALPFYLMYRKNNLKRKKTLQTLLDLSKKRNLEIGQHDCWSDTVIAIDKRQSTLFFSLHSANPMAYEIIELSTLEKSELVRVENDNNGIKALGLQIRCAKGSTFYLEFFNDSKKMMPANEYEFARKWLSIIEKSLQANKRDRNSAQAS